MSAVSLDGIVQEIVTSTSTTRLAERLKSFAPKDVRDTILASVGASGQDPLAIMDARVNTLGYLYILSARLSVATGAPMTFALITDFCTNFDPEQARLAPERVTMLAKGIARLAEQNRSPHIAVLPLHALVTRYPPDLSYLTTIHPIFLEHCVSSRHFTAALPVLRTPISQISLALCPDLHFNDNLVYHYAGGVALAALKHFGEAEEMFTICMSSPAQVPAALQMEAYKKLVLVQLILHGKAPKPPQYTHGTLMRIMRASPYGALLKHYPHNMKEVETLLEKEGKTFVNDNNMGLVKQALDRAPRWSIRKLTSTYLTLSLTEIGTAVGISDAERVRSLLLSMIDNGEIHATLTASGTVTFSDPPMHISKGEVDRILREAQTQGKVLVDLDLQVARSREFISKALKTREESGQWAADDEDIMFGGRDAFEDSVY